MDYTLYRSLYYVFLIINLYCSIAIIILPIFFNDIKTAKYTSSSSINIVYGITAIYMCNCTKI